MTIQNLFKVAENLEQQIEVASGSARLKLQPELSRVLCEIQAEGKQVPLRLRKLEAALSDEAVEARFDNMPV